MVKREFFYRHYGKYTLQLGDHQTNSSIFIYDDSKPRANNEDHVLSLRIYSDHINEMILWDNRSRIINYTEACIIIHSLNIPENIKQKIIMILEMILNKYNKHLK